MRAWPTGSSPRGRGKQAFVSRFATSIGLIPAWAGKTRRRDDCLSRKGAHPRVGGENLVETSLLASCPGSSPRGRGKLDGELLGQVDDGLIPAWAGKTLAASGCAAGCGAHPRVGGENLACALPSAVTQGSSPRGRGKPDLDQSQTLVLRLIPAWAGKTSRAVCVSENRAAHPRVGGENIHVLLDECEERGSSPRGRGKLSLSLWITRLFGLIPAWAGKTNARMVWSSQARAHPRVGGENPRYSIVIGPSQGSSPRGRGKRGLGAGDTLTVGLIPAWAGKTRFGVGLASGSRAHPRVGGENYTSSPTASRRAGSSPRGRGKRGAPVGSTRIERLIPAWAGKTSCSDSYPASKRAHPRVGGENAPPVGAGVAVGGSSPRGRGKLQGIARNLSHEGLIPAWAGKTRFGVGLASGRWAHPRVGGENVKSDSWTSLTSGSSPRGRGKPTTPAANPAPSRLIPAWAGKTEVSGAQVFDCQAHPRVGGENLQCLTAVWPRSGSSPRGRGKPLGGRHRQRHRGLIPAWAGKTSAVGRYPRSRAAHPRVGGENRKDRRDGPVSTGSSPRGRGKRRRSQLRPRVPGLIPAWAGKTTTRRAVG